MPAPDRREQVTTGDGNLFKSLMRNAGNLNHASPGTDFAANAAALSNRVTTCTCNASTALKLLDCYCNRAFCNRNDRKKCQNDGHLPQIAGVHISSHVKEHGPGNRRTVLGNII